MLPAAETTTFLRGSSTSNDSVSLEPIFSLLSFLPSGWLVCPCACRNAVEGGRGTRLTWAGLVAGAPSELDAEPMLGECLQW